MSWSWRGGGGNAPGQGDHIAMNAEQFEAFIQAVRPPQPVPQPAQVDKDKDPHSCSRQDKPMRINLLIIPRLPVLSSGRKQQQNFVTSSLLKDRVQTNSANCSSNALKNLVRIIQHLILLTYMLIIK